MKFPTYPQFWCCTAMERQAIMLFPHDLQTEEGAILRSVIVGAQIDRTAAWGFRESGVWAWVKRAIYFGWYGWVRGMRNRKLSTEETYFLEHFREELQR